MRGNTVFTSRFELRTFSLRVVSFVRYVFEDMAYFDTFLYFFSRIMYSTRLRPLPLSNAERQRRYRARKIAAMGDAFLKRESERVKAYQKKVADMTDEEKARNRRLTNIRVRRHRKKKREEKLAAQADVVEDEDWSSDGSISNDDETVVIAVMVVIEHRNSEVCISTFIHLFIPALRCSCCE